MHWAICLISALALSAGQVRAEPARQPSKLLIVVAASQYRESLRPWVDRRQAEGYRVEEIDPVAILGARNGNEAAELLCQEIARRASAVVAEPVEDEAHVGPAGFVLLVGDAPGPDEPLDATKLIPAVIRSEKARPSSPRYFVSDNQYGLPDNRGIPRLAVGRWPVRTPEEVAMQLRKSLRHGSEQLPGLHRRDITLLATTPNYDMVFDPVLEKMAMGMIAAQLGPRWGLRALYSSPRSEFFPGPEQTARQVTRWLEEATPFTLFAGHGWECGVDCVRCEGKTYPVLDTEVAATICGDRPGTILWMSACSCGAFALHPPGRGLAESLVMNSRGPVAVVAGSAETSAYANLLLCLGLAQDVIERPPDTLGEAVLRFKRAVYSPGPPLLKKLLLSLEPTEKPECLPEDHQYLYNLLGDPTLSLRLPRPVNFAVDVTAEAAEPAGVMHFRIEGKLADWDSGTIWLSLALNRLAIKEPLPDPAAIEDAAARQSVYLERFLKANDKLVAQGQAAVNAGRFELRLAVPESLAPQVRWLQLYVCTDPASDGTWTDGAGAQAVRLVPENIED